MDTFANLAKSDIKRGDYAGAVGWVEELDKALSTARAEIAELRAALATHHAAGVPEAAQQNGGLVRAALIDLMVVEQAALNGASGIFEQQSDFRARFARGRAALAATDTPPIDAQSVRDAALVKMVNDAAVFIKWVSVTCRDECVADEAEKFYAAIRDEGMKTTTAPASSDHKRDADRLDWLDKANREEHLHTPYLDNGLWNYPYLVKGEGLGGGVGLKSFESLREAIDAAMKEKP